MSKTPKKVAIVGHGYVGKALEQFFGSRYDLVIYDPGEGKTDKGAVNACDMAIVSVPTPAKDDGSVDLSALTETFSWLTAPVVVIKSTVPPGTTSAYAKEKGMEDRLVFPPEFIGEGNYPIPFWDNIPHPTDTSFHSFHVFGGTRRATQKAIEFWKPAAGPFAKFIQTDSTTAELMKYMENAWIATKVTFCNEFFEIAKTFSVDYTELRELWLLDGRVGPSHTLVFENKRGFDGKCIPKDVNGIVRASEKAGYAPEFLKSAIEHNKQFRR